MQNTEKTGISGYGGEQVDGYYLNISEKLLCYKITSVCMQ